MVIAESDKIEMELNRTGMHPGHILVRSAAGIIGAAVALFQRLLRDLTDPKFKLLFFLNKWMVAVLPLWVVYFVLAYARKYSFAFLYIVGMSVIIFVAVCVFDMTRSAAQAISASFIRCLCKCSG